MHRIFRRTVVCVCALIVTLLTSSAHAQSADHPLRVAIIGLEHGHVAGFLKELPNQHGVELVGVVDSDEALAKRYAQQFHLDQGLFYAQLEPMIRARHPQALLVYTAVSGHRRVIEKAAENGLSVMVEKPLTMSLEDALAIRATARAHHIQVLTNYVSTWSASNWAAFDAAESGTLGDLRKIVVYAGHQGPKEIGVQPEFLKWLEDPDQNGDGALYDFGCYGADLATWLMHGEAPLSVTAIAQTDKPEVYPHVADDATIVLRYPKAQAVLMASWNWPFSRMDMEIYGTKGDVLTKGADKLKARTAGRAQETETTAEPPAAPNDSPLHYLAAVLSGAVQSSADPTSLDTNVVVMQILDAARRSAKEGRTIQLAPLPK
jgi:glucose-fructose oxidoreductase